MATENTLKETKMKTAYLKLLSGEGQHAFIALSGNRVEIGRAPSNDVILNSAHVSRKHVVFSCENNVWMVKDLSTNGVSVNSIRLPKNEFVILDNADKISLVPTGSFQYQFQYLSATNNERSGLPPLVEMSDSVSVRHNDNDQRELRQPPLSVSKCLANENLETSSCKPCKSTLWKRRRNNVEIGSSDSDEPNNSKVRIVAKNNDSSESSVQSCDEFGDLEEEDAPIRKTLCGIIAAQDPNSECDSSDDGKNSTKADTKRRNEEKISSLKRKVQKLEGENSKLTMACQKLEGEKSAMQKEAQSEKDGLLTSIMDCFGTEFSCAICTEIFINPTVINCGHTFCSFCLTQWLKEKSVCCICRKAVTSQSRHIQANNLLTTIWEKMPEEMRLKRENDIMDREQTIQDAELRDREEEIPLVVPLFTEYEEAFVRFMLSENFFDQIIDRHREELHVLRRARPRSRSQSVNVSGTPPARQRPTTPSPPGSASPL